MLPRDTDPTNLAASWTANIWASETMLVGELLEICSKSKQVFGLEIT